MNNTNKPPLIAWWAIWFSLQMGLIFFYIFLSAAAKVTSSGSPLWLIALGALVISSIIRWVMLPRFDNAQKAFPIFIMGMAFAESLCFFGLFLVPEHKLELFLLSFLGMLQFIPIFARRFYT